MTVRVTSELLAQLVRSLGQVRWSLWILMCISVGEISSKLLQMAELVKDNKES